MSRKILEINNMTRTFFAPGRVNLIGDHTDYNGGMVFPAALTMGTFLTISELADKQRCTFASENDPRSFTLKIEELEQKQNCWVDYPLGVLREFRLRGIEIAGFEFRYRGNLPIGAALSSSASIEVVTAYALNEVMGKPFTLLELVQMAQHAENDFVGMNCGIMDQFASGFGKKECAIALDCATLQYEWVPLEMQGLKFVITNTNKKRGLVDSAYNQRREECNQALEVLRKRFDIDNLCQLTPEQFESAADSLSGSVLCRARHAVSEHARVVAAIGALQQKDMQQFGALMNASHASLRDDYEVTCPELDFIATFAQSFDGVLGSRMTGAGFGGCTVTLIAEAQVDAFVQQLQAAYEEKFSLRADCYVADIGEGAQVC